MTALTIKNIPDSLYQVLKSTAKAHRRSINNEVITLLEEKLVLRDDLAGTWVSRTEAMRAGISTGAITEKAIDREIKSLSEKEAKEVSDFIAFLKTRFERARWDDLMKAQASAMSDVWDNDEDEIWDHV